MSAKMLVAEDQIARLKTGRSLEELGDRATLVNIPGAAISCLWNSPTKPRLE